MPRAEPQNEKILEALENRRYKCEQLNHRDKFAYERAIDAIRRFEGRIVKIGQLRGIPKHQITARIFEEIAGILNGTVLVDVTPPTPQQLARAQAQPTLVFENPPGRGTGTWAILLTLYRAKEAGYNRLVNDQIKRWAKDILQVNMTDEVSGFSRWTCINTCERKAWVIRDRLSRQWGGRGTGSYGGRKDEFYLTETGKELARMLWEREFPNGDGPEYVGGQQAGHNAGSRASPAYTAPAAAAAAAGGAPTGFDAVLDALCQGPEFVRSGAGRGAAAAAFAGRGRVLGGAGGAAGGAAAGRRLDFEDVDEQGFPVYRSELFEQDDGEEQDALYESGLLAAAAAAAGPAAGRSRGPRGAGRGSAPAASGRGRGTGRSSMPAAGSAGAAARAAVLDGLIPRVAKKDMPVPLCDNGKGCTSCNMLRDFLLDAAALKLHMMLNKAKQEHVQKTVKYLASLEGGSHALAVDAGADKGSVIVSKLAGGDGSGTRLPAAAGAPVHDPLGALEGLLSRLPKQVAQQPAPTTSRVAAASPTAAAAAAAAKRRSSAGCPLSPAQRAAAAAELRIAQQQQEDELRRKHQVQEQQQEERQLRQSPRRPQQEARPVTAAAAAEVGQEQPICLLDPTQQDGDEDFDLLQQLQAAEYFEEAAALLGEQSTEEEQQQQGGERRQRQQHHKGRDKLPAVCEVVPDSEGDEGEVGGCQLGRNGTAGAVAAGINARQQSAPTAAAAAAAAPRESAVCLIDSQDAEPQWADEPQDDDILATQPVDAEVEALPGAAAATAAGAAAAAAASPQRKRDRQQLSGSSADAVAGAGTRHSKKRRKQQQSAQPSQQQQPQPLCIDLLESQGMGNAGLGFGLDGLLGRQEASKSALTAAAAAAAAATGTSGHTRHTSNSGRSAAGADGRAAPADNTVPGGYSAGAAVRGAAADARATRSAAAAATPGGAAAADVAFELKLVVDDKERRENDNPNQIYSNLYQEHKHNLVPLLPEGITVDVDRASLPLGDYMWLVLEGGATSSAAAAAAAASDDEHEEERAAAEERAACVLAGAVVERKTMRDLVGRSGMGDHLRQLQRMHHMRELFPLQLLLIENKTIMAGRYSVFQGGPRSSSSACTVCSEESLFDFQVRAAVSPYGSTQRILFTPSTGDSRAVLLATSQLLLHEQHHLRKQEQQHSSQQWRQQEGDSQQQQQQQRRLLAASQTTYAQLQQLCQRVNRGLPHMQLPFELSSHDPVLDVEPEAAFYTARAAGKSQFAGLQLHVHKTYKQLQIVQIEGHNLLMLLNGFYAEATAANRLPSATAPAAGDLPVLQAVDVALEVATMLTSYLEAFVTEAGAAASGTAAAAAAPAGDDGANRGSSADAVSADGSRPFCHMLLVQNLVGPKGAVSYIANAQQQAAINGAKPKTKPAAQRHEEACQCNEQAIKSYLWLWLLCFMRHGWHVHLSQTKDPSLFLRVAGRRCCWLADRLAGQQQQQQQQARAPLQAQEAGSGAASQAGDTQQEQQQQDRHTVRPSEHWAALGDEGHAGNTGGAAAAAAGTGQHIRQHSTPGGSTFMDWLDDQLLEEAAVDQQHRQSVLADELLPPAHAARVPGTAAAAPAAPGVPTVSSSPAGGTIRLDTALGMDRGAQRQPQQQPQPQPQQPLHTMEMDVIVCDTQCGDDDDVILVE